MPKIECTCGNIIGLGDIPSPNQSLIISDKDFDQFHGQVNAEDIYSAMRIVAHCNTCSRLHIFWNGFDKPATIYQQDINS